MTDNTQIQASDEVLRYLAKKLEFYRSRSRLPKIVLTERSCSGAVFRLFFEPPLDTDAVVSINGLDIYIQPDLLAEYGGFVLEMEVFFFASRLKVSPQKQSFTCECKSKCNKAAAIAADEV